MSGLATDPPRQGRKVAKMDALRHPFWNAGAFVLVTATFTEGLDCRARFIGCGVDSWEPCFRRHGRSSQTEATLPLLPETTFSINTGFTLISFVLMGRTSNRLHKETAVIGTKAPQITTVTSFRPRTLHLLTVRSDNSTYEIRFVFARVAA
jgi:hypothetical protein